MSMTDHNPYLDPTLMKELQFLSSHSASHADTNQAQQLENRQHRILNKINELKVRSSGLMDFYCKSTNNQTIEANTAQSLKQRQQAILNKIAELRSRLNTIRHPTVSLSDLFVSDDYAPPIPFHWPKYKQMEKNTDVCSLIRSSCKLLSENAKFIDINHAYIEPYAQSLSKNDIHQLFGHFTWHYGQNLDIKLETEREIINVSCLYIMLQFGHGFRNALHKYCNGRGASLTIGIGIQNMLQKYKQINCTSLNGITLDEISQLFEVDCTQSFILKSFCDLLRQCIQETIDVLTQLNCNDFADYIYLKLNECWIEHQIHNTTTVDFTGQSSLGLVLAPTISNVIRRTVVLDCVDKRNLDLKNCIVYAINDDVVYDDPFDDIIQRINGLKKQWNSRITISFGNNTSTTPNTVRYLLWNLINDFSSLNDQYLYKNILNDGEALQVYLFKRAQLMIMELSNNLAATNPVFDLKHNMDELCAAVDNVVPFVLMKDGVIQIKKKYKKAFEAYINSGTYVLKASDLEVELRGVALHALELILKERDGKDVSVAALTYYLWKKGKFPDYRKYERHYTRDTIFY
eukprot:248111_1